MGVLTIAILLSVAALTSPEPQNSIDIDKIFNIPEIESVLGEVTAQSPQGYSLDDADKHHSKHHSNKHVIFDNKQNNLKQKLAAAEHSRLNKPQTNSNQKILRVIEEAICEATGRCGCSGTRCGCSGNRCNDDRKDRNYDSKELSIILDSLQSDLENDRSSNDLRCGCVNNQPHRGQRYNLRCGCKRRKPYKRTRNDNNKNYGGNGKESSSDDNLDVVVLELNDLLDKKSTHRDYTRTKDLTRNDNSQILAYHKKDDEVDERNKNKNGVSPDALFDEYQAFRATALKKLMNHVLFQENDIDISRFSMRQQKIIKDLQEEAKSKPIDTDQLKKRLASIIFGPESAVEVLPHSKKNENIYIPQWLYNKIQNSQANPPIARKKHSRSVLPLTKKQKLKLQKLIKKQQSEAAKKPQVWRRSLSEDLQNYGAPFELDIQGLGQVNA